MPGPGPAGVGVPGVGVGMLRGYHNVPWRSQKINRKGYELAENIIHYPKNINNSKVLINQFKPIIN